MSEITRNITILRAGPLTSTSQETTTTIFARIEVATPEGPAVLNLSRDAAEVLAEELSKYLQARGSR
jgi:hypothetical protein